MSNWYGTCVWQALGDHKFKTECGHLFDHDIDDRKLHEWKHCLYCGHLLQIDDQPKEVVDHATKAVEG